MKTLIIAFLSLFGITVSWGAEASPPRQLRLNYITDTKQYEGDPREMWPYIAGMPMLKKRDVEDIFCGKFFEGYTGKLNRPVLDYIQETERFYDLELYTITDSRVTDSNIVFNLSLVVSKDDHIGFLYIVPYVMNANTGTENALFMLSRPLSEREKENPIIQCLKLPDTMQRLQENLLPDFISLSDNSPTAHVDVKSPEDTLRYSTFFYISREIQNKEEKAYELFKRLPEDVKLSLLPDFLKQRMQAPLDETLEQPIKDKTPSEKKEGEK